MDKMVLPKTTDLRSYPSHWLRQRAPPIHGDMGVYGFWKYHLIPISFY